MTSILVCLFRFAVVIFGYAVAALAASAFLNLVSLGALDWRPDELPWVVTGSVVFTIPVVALVVAYFAFIPAVPVMLLAEILGKRDWLFHAIGGAVVAAVAVGLSWPFSQGFDPGEGAIIVIDPAVSGPRFIMLVIGSGLVGGFAYWLTAGRWAGTWRRRGSAPISPGRSGS